MPAWAGWAVSLMRELEASPTDPGGDPAPGAADAGPHPGDHPAGARDRPAVHSLGSAGPGDSGAAALNRSASTAAAMVRSKPVVSLMLEGGDASTRTGRPSRSNRPAWPILAKTAGLFSVNS